MHFLDHQSKDKSPHPLPSRNAHREWQRVVQWDEEGGVVWLHRCTESELVGAGGDRWPSEPRMTAQMVESQAESTCS